MPTPPAARQHRRRSPFLDSDAEKGFLPTAHLKTFGWPHPQALAAGDAAWELEGRAVRTGGHAAPVGRTRLHPLSGGPACTPNVKPVHVKPLYAF